MSNESGRSDELLRQDIMVVKTQLSETIRRLGLIEYSVRIPGGPFVTTEAFYNLKEKHDKLSTNILWVVRIVLGLVIGSVVGLVIVKGPIG